MQVVHVYHIIGFGAIRSWNVSQPEIAKKNPQNPLF